MVETISKFLEVRTDEQIVMSEALSMLCNDMLTPEQYLEIVDIAQDPVELEVFIKGVN